MIGAILAFGFVVLGSKVVFGFAVVWGLLPGVESCSTCDGETTPVEAPRGLRALFAWLRIQSRWCPSCGESFLARGARPPMLYVGAPKSEPRPRPVEPAQAPVR